MHTYELTFTNGKALTVKAPDKFGASQTGKFHAFCLCTKLATVRAI